MRLQINKLVFNLANDSVVEPQAIQSGMPIPAFVSPHDRIEASGGGSKTGLSDPDNSPPKKKSRDSEQVQPSKATKTAEKNDELGQLCV